MLSIFTATFLNDALIIVDFVADSVSKTRSTVPSRLPSFYERARFAF